MVQVSRIRDEISGLTDKIEVPQVDVRHMADQVTERAVQLAGRPKPKRRKATSPIVGVGLLLLLVVVLFRVRARNGNDDEIT